jgi:hypothetical protein
MFTETIGKVLDFTKSETTAKIVLKIITGLAAIYFGTTISSEQVAMLGAGYLAISAAIDGWWHKNHPDAVPYTKPEVKP